MLLFQFQVIAVGLKRSRITKVILKIRGTQYYKKFWANWAC